MDFPLLANRQNQTMKRLMEDFFNVPGGLFLLLG